jgi:hypothetical protein
MSSQLTICLNPIQAGTSGLLYFRRTEVHLFPLDPTTPRVYSKKCLEKQCHHDIPLALIIRFNPFQALTLTNVGVPYNISPLDMSGTSHFWSRYRSKKKFGPSGTGPTLPIYSPFSNVFVK